MEFADLPLGRAVLGILVGAGGAIYLMLKGEFVTGPILASIFLVGLTVGIATLQLVDWSVGQFLRTPYWPQISVSVMVFAGVSFSAGFGARTLWFERVL